MPFKPPPPKKEECPEWIISFTDMTSLEMSFFIVLMSFSTPSREKLMEVRGSIQSAFGFFGTYYNNDSDTPPNPIAQGREEENQNAPRNLSPFVVIKDHEPNEEIMRLRDESGEAIDFYRVVEGYCAIMGEIAMFPELSDQMTIASYAHIAKVAHAVAESDFQMTIVGYVSQAEAKMLGSNERALDLAVRRAVATAMRLNRDSGVPPKKLSVAGYAPTARDLPGRVDILLSKADAFRRGQEEEEQ